MTEHEEKARKIADRHGGHETLKKLLAADIAVALDEAVEAERERFRTIIKKELFFIPEGDLRRVHKAIRGEK